MKFILWGLTAIVFVSLTHCAHKIKRRSVSEYLFSTKRGTENFIEDLKKTLESKRYTIRNIDTTLGILTTRPRKFMIHEDGAEVQADHTIQVRQEGGSVKVRIQYKCNYTGQMEACSKEDAATEEKISRFEPKLIQLIKKVVARKDSTEVKLQELEGLGDSQE